MTDMQMQILRKRAALMKRDIKEAIAGIVADLVRGNYHLCRVYNAPLNGGENGKNGIKSPLPCRSAVKNRAGVMRRAKTA